jgi:predicted glycosyltransferase
MVWDHSGWKEFQYYHNDYVVVDSFAFGTVGELLYVLNNLLGLF